MRKGLAAVCLLGLISLSFSALAADIGSPHLFNAVITKPSDTPTHGLITKIAPATKKVALMQLRLTPKERHKFFAGLHRQATDMNALASTSSNNLPATIDLGMNTVPVLNQGQHGTCVTFAITAAIDALLGRGDYISQLCSLELGEYLEQRSYVPSGWNGSWGTIVIQHLLDYGIVSKKTENTQSCGGLTSYPLNEAVTGSPLSLDDYKRFSENIHNNISWYPVLTFDERIEWDPEDTTQARKVLMRVKKLLASQSTRLTFGVGIVPEFCSVGACGRYHQAFDTWVMTDDIRELIEDDSLDMAGHEMTIIGYNDQAVVKDIYGKKHKGVLIIRNSWGEDVGDNGNYYMTYDYFMQFAMEVHALSLA